MIAKSEKAGYRRKLSDQPEQKSCRILIGTSGFSYSDWRGRFYPANLKFSEMLDYYAHRFQAVEINSTYYFIPRLTTIQRLVQQTPDDFVFVIKAHKTFTHLRKAIEEPTEKFCVALQPLIKSGKLGGILAQFPGSFRFSTANLDYLVKSRRLFGNLNFFVEFRHKTWETERVFQTLWRTEIGYVCVDMPQINQLMSQRVVVTSPFGYVRFHGRNRKGWQMYGADRYNYLYTDAELKRWARKIQNMAQQARQIFVFFNNGFQGQGVENAKTLKRLLRITRKNAEV